MPPYMVELCNVTNATIPGGTLSLMKTLKVPCSVELINVTSPPFWVALHNVKKCHHERVDELSHIGDAVKYEMYETVKPHSIMCDV